MSYQPPVQLWGSAFHLTGCKPYRGLRVTKADIHILRARPELVRATLETWMGTVAEETEKEIDLRNIRSDLLEKRIAFLFPQKSFSEETEAQRT